MLRPQRYVYSYNEIYITIFMFVSKHLYIIIWECPEIRIYNENESLFHLYLASRSIAHPEGYEQIDFA